MITILRSLIIMSILAVLLATPAAMLQEQGDLKPHTIRFFIDPDLVEDILYTRSVLQKYVNDMNSILEKNTCRHLEFDIQTGVVITDIQPHTNFASSPLPEEGFEIWAQVIASDYPFSYGGYGGLDKSGAGVLAGLEWAKIYDPDLVTGSELQDYWTQINNMLHELAHVFGAGIGEYYKLATIIDTSGEYPLINIDAMDPGDIYWSDKNDFFADPLLRNANREGFYTREELLEYTKYSDLTAVIISGNYRNELPSVDLDHIFVSVVDGDGNPVTDADIKIWSVIGKAPYLSNLITEEITDAQGKISFAWGGASDPHNNYDFLRLIKVYKDGFIPSAMYISIYDADIAKLVDGKGLLELEIRMFRSVYLPAVYSRFHCPMEGHISKLI